MKRFLTCMLVAMLVVTSMSVAAFAAQPGETVDVTVTVSGEFAQYHVVVSAPAGLTITGISGSVTANPANGHVAWASASNVTSHSFTVTVQLANDIKPGTYYLGVSVVDATKIVGVDNDTDDIKDGYVTTSISGSGSVTIECEHNWSEWTVTTPATCSTEGVETRTCSACGGTETRAIAKTAHAWGEWTTVQESTCIVEGKAERVCASCGEKETKTLPLAEHTWNKNWEKDDQNHWHVCEVCGAKGDEDKHGYGSWETGREPTETEAGYWYKVCLTCGHTVTKPKEYDAPPPTGDVTPIITMGVVSMLAAAAYVSKRKFAK